MSMRQPQCFSLESLEVNFSHLTYQSVSSQMCKRGRWRKGGSFQTQHIRLASTDVTLAMMTIENSKKRKK